MRVFRITRPKWEGNFNGSGIPARWNEAGRRMLYTSSSLALALLEILVHIKRDQVPDYVWLAAEIPDHLMEFSGLTEVPPDSVEIGTRWLETSGRKEALRVPSVIIPEQNILLNPVHTDFSRIQWADPVELKVDPRLLQVF